MDIITTPAELMDRMLWIDACAKLGISDWAVNEGQMRSDEEIRIPEAVAVELGLLPRR